MTNVDFLISLLSSNTPSGFENFSNDTSLETAISYVGIKPEIDNIDNIVFKKGSIKKNAKKIMLSAHYDENAFIVSGITKDGMLHVLNVGGVDPKTLEGSWVNIISDLYIVNDKAYRTLIPGIIGKKAIHLESKDERNKVDEIEDILVDIGCTSKEEVDELQIHIGSPIVFKKTIDVSFGHNRKFIVANALDDKIGVYCVTEVFNLIDEKYLIDNNIALYLVWCSQEEVGLRGAKTVTQQINPNISIDVDVTHETGVHGGKKNLGKCEFGKGVVLEYSAASRYKLLNELKQLANNFAISYQEQASKPGGNNCDAIEMNTTNCLTAHLAIPNRNMHTQVEMCHWNDIEACIELMKVYIENIYD